MSSRIPSIAIVGFAFIRRHMIKLTASSLNGCFISDALIVKARTSDTPTFLGPVRDPILLYRDAKKIWSTDSIRKRGVLSRNYWLFVRDPHQRRRSIWDSVALREMR